MPLPDSSIGLAGLLIPTYDLDDITPTAELRSLGAIGFKDGARYSIQTNPNTMALVWKLADTGSDGINLSQVDAEISHVLRNLDTEFPQASNQMIVIRGNNLTRANMSHLAQLLSNYKGQWNGVPNGSVVSAGWVVNHLGIIYMAHTAHTKDQSTTPPEDPRQLGRTDQLPGHPAERQQRAGRRGGRGRRRDVHVSAVHGRPRGHEPDLLAAHGRRRSGQHTQPAGGDRGPVGQEPGRRRRPAGPDARPGGPDGHPGMAR